MYTVWRTVREREWYHSFLVQHLPTHLISLFVFVRNVHLVKTKRNLAKTETDLDQESDINSTGLIVVDSSPQYMVCPIVPYRVKMVRPGARFVAVLRDPTDR